MVDFVDFATQTVTISLRGAFSQWNNVYYKDIASIAWDKPFAEIYAIRVEQPGGEVRQLWCSLLNPTLTHTGDFRVYRGTNTGNDYSQPLRVVAFGRIAG